METLRKVKLNDPIFRTEHLLNHMVDGVKDYAIFLLDPKGYIISWNAGAERIKGYRAEEVIGKHFSLFYTIEDIINHKPEYSLNTAVINGRCEETGWRVRKNGSLFWANAIITPLKGKKGEILGFTKITRDLTHQKNTEERFKGLLESAPDTMVIINSKGQILMVNAQTEKLFEFDREEIVGKEVECLIPDRFREIHLVHRNHYNADPKVRSMGAGLELYGKHKNGKEFPVEVSLSPVELADEGAYVFASVRDITMQKKAESEIMQLNDELARRTAELETINKELESFSYSVSHDLRAPLRSIDGFSNLILKKYADRLDESGKDYFKRVIHASQQMGQLIDDLLIIARITRAEMNLEMTDLSAMAESIASDLKLSQPERKADFIIQSGMTDKADRNLMNAALRNLLENAWKYSRKAAKAKIEFGTVAGENKTIYYIRDNGVGFDMKYSEKLFGAFQRLHSITEFEGTGIGLATVQRIIRRHGGNIWTEGEVDRGATFYFTLK